MRRTSVRLFVLSLVLLGSFAMGVPSASAAPVGFSGVGLGSGDMSRPWDDLSPTPGREYHLNVTYTGVFGRGAPSAGGLQCTFALNENIVSAVAAGAGSSAITSGCYGVPPMTASVELTAPIGFRVGNSANWLFEAHICINGTCGDGYAALSLKLLYDTSPGGRNVTVVASTFSAGGL